MSALTFRQVLTSIEGEAHRLAQQHQTKCTRCLNKDATPCDERLRITALWTFLFDFSNRMLLVEKANAGDAAALSQLLTMDELRLPPALTKKPVIALPERPEARR